MEGVRINSKTGRLTATVDKVGLELISNNAGFEVMLQEIPLNSIAWVCPADSIYTVEFFFILQGKISLTFDDGKVTELYEGDTFEVMGIKQDLLITPLTAVKLLYITNTPMFESLYGSLTDYDAIMKIIDAKDNRTYAHSKNVTYLCTQIGKKMLAKGFAVNFENLIQAASFHDVGISMLPDEILSKRTTFSGLDRLMIERHSSIGANMLTKYSQEIRDIVLCHHERIDGSGYPNGITGLEIPIEAQIIGVADSFESMTGYRPYKSSMSFERAAAELAKEKDKYNTEITSVLKQLVEEGEIVQTSLFTYRKDGE